MKNIDHIEISPDILTRLGFELRKDVASSPVKHFRILLENAIRIGRKVRIDFLIWDDGTTDMAVKEIARGERLVHVYPVPKYLHELQLLVVSYSGFFPMLPEQENYATNPY